MTKLTDSEIREKLATLPGWKHDAGMLVHDYTFPDFVTGFAFVTRLALMAEKVNHHPDIDIRYSRVRVGLTSHDSGGITARDVAMAEAIGKL